MASCIRNGTRSCSHSFAPKQSRGSMACKSRRMPPMCCSLEDAYRTAYTMSQLYVANRPEPIPLTDYQKRRHERDFQEIIEAGKKRGKTADVIRDGLTKLDVLLGDIVSLERMKASDWVTVAADVNGVAEKIILLRTCYPTANLIKLVSNRPKLMLQSTEELTDNAAKVKVLLASSQDPDAIIEAVPDLADYHTLSEALSNMRSWFPDRDPVECLDKDPTFLLRTGQSAIEPDAEYGIMAFT